MQEKIFIGTEWATPIGELWQPQRQRRRKRHNFKHLTTKKGNFARFARAFPQLGMF